MPVRQTAVSSRPRSCRYCVAGFLAEAHVVDSLRGNGIDVTDVQATDAVRTNVLAAVQEKDPVFFTGFGHGNSDIFTGDDEKAILDLNNVSTMSGRIVRLLSCLTARRLGPAMISAGAWGYIGYYEEWTWIQANLDQDPYVDPYACSFYRSADTDAMELGKGRTLKDAADAMVAVYNEEIERWTGSSDPYASDEITWLTWDRDAMRVLGDMDATITGKIVRDILVEVRLSGYKDWSKVVEVEEPQLKEMVVTGLPDEVVIGTEYKLHVMDRESGVALVGAEAFVEDKSQGLTDSNGDVVIKIPEEVG